MDCNPCQNNHSLSNANQMSNMMPANYDQQTPVKKSQVSKKRNRK
ncbi:hypothetical protein [Neobacillus sp. DY30]|nr:hypothetical protein [Neobacillus sp. DY30]WHX97977.1 hypothetical protein QNH29_14930 [Neobacillus sp. DY30]